MLPSTRSLPQSPVPRSPAPHSPVKGRPSTSSASLERQLHAIPERLDSPDLPPAGGSATVPRRIVVSDSSEGADWKIHMAAVQSRYKNDGSRLPSGQVFNVQFERHCRTDLYSDLDVRLEPPESPAPVSPSRRHIGEADKLVFLRRCSPYKGIIANKLKATSDLKAARKEVRSSMKISP